MYLKRVIPSLLISSRRLIKSIKFQEDNYVGDPINAIKIFNEKEVDELFIIDKNISINSIEPDYEYIKQLTGECFMPICYGGGISSLEVANKIFDTGLEKILLQNAAIKDPQIIYNLTKVYGSSSIALSVDVRKNSSGNYKIFSYKESDYINIDLEIYLKKYHELGVGEILINNIDKDGTLAGPDFDLIESLNIINIDIPIIVQGGISSLEDIKKLFSYDIVSGVAIGSFFIYYGTNRAVLINYLNDNDKKFVYDLANE
tara:strand:- start:280 stop:1056 length:777 start_codon:yes stop_codon:yes gene_type:complete